MEEIARVLHNLFQKLEKEGTLPHSLYEVSQYKKRKRKTDKDGTRKENYRASLVVW